MLVTCDGFKYGVVFSYTEVQNLSVIQYFSKPFLIFFLSTPLAKSKTLLNLHFDGPHLFLPSVILAGLGQACSFNLQSFLSCHRLASVI